MTRPTIVREAIDWMVLMRSGEASPADATRFKSWREADVRHEDACRQVAHSMQGVAHLGRRGVSAEVARRALDATARRASRRVALLGTAGVGLGVGAIGWQVADSDALLADTRTATGERRQTALADGTSVWLDARTAIDTSVGGDRFSMRIHHGRLLANTPAAHGWRIKTPFGSVTAEGARVMVSVLAAGVGVAAFAGRVAVTGRNGLREALEVGRSTVLGAQGSQATQPARETDTAWLQGMVVMDNRPLAELIAALQPYRRGVLRVDPAVAQRRVSGVYLLDDTELTLRSLAHASGLAVRRVSDYWVTVGAA